VTLACVFMRARDPARPTTPCATCCPAGVDALSRSRNAKSMAEMWPTWPAGRQTARRHPLVLLPPKKLKHDLLIEKMLLRSHILFSNNVHSLTFVFWGKDDLTWNHLKASFCCWIFETNRAILSCIEESGQISQNFYWKSERKWKKWFHRVMWMKLRKFVSWPSKDVNTGFFWALHSARGPNSHSHPPKSFVNKQSPVGVGHNFL
jgi:hypothetical protein